MLVSKFNLSKHRSPLAKAAMIASSIMAALKAAKCSLGQLKPMPVQRKMRPQLAQSNLSVGLGLVSL